MAPISFASSTLFLYIHKLKIKPSLSLSLPQLRNRILYIHTYTHIENTIMGSSSREERSEIAFFDVETTVPTRPDERIALLEFGAILVCPRKLVKLDEYSTLVRPADLSLIYSLSPRSNGITPDAVLSAPTFLQISDRVYDLLHGLFLL